MKGKAAFDHSAVVDQFQRTIAKKRTAKFADNLRSRQMNFVTQLRNKSGSLSSYNITLSIKNSLRQNKEGEHDTIDSRRHNQTSQRHDDVDYIQKGHVVILKSMDEINRRQDDVDFRIQYIRLDGKLASRLVKTLGYLA